MSENKPDSKIPVHKPAPGDGLRSLKSTLGFRAINFELYAKPSKTEKICDENCKTYET